MKVCDRHLLGRVLLILKFHPKSPHQLTIWYCALHRKTGSRMERHRLWSLVLVLKLLALPLRTRPAMAHLVAAVLFRQAAPLRRRRRVSGRREADVGQVLFGGGSQATGRGISFGFRWRRDDIAKGPDSERGRVTNVPADAVVSDLCIVTFGCGFLGVVIRFRTHLWLLYGHRWGLWCQITPGKREIRVKWNELHMCLIVRICVYYL